MVITLQQIIALLPLIIVGLTVVFVVISVAWKRKHLLSATLSIIGLNTALASLWFVGRVGAIDITPLIHIDNYAIFHTSLVLIASLATCTFAYLWLEGYSNNKEEFYLLILIATVGGILLANTNHMTALFLGIELVSLPIFGLIGYTFSQKRSLEASIKYTILSSIASSFLLFGIALLYTQTGSLSFCALRKVFDYNLIYKPLLMIGIGMIMVGLGFKLSLVPFHLWTPDVYQGAPAPVSTFLATVSKIAILGVAMRLFFNLSINYEEVVRIILSVIAFVSIIFGNLMALSQKNIKRLLGYSSISHLGYMLIALIALHSSKISIETLNVYLIGYLFSNLGAFGVISLMSSPYRGPDADSLFSYRGLFWHRPILSAVMTIMMLSLAGIPMTLGFIGKFYILAISVQLHLWWLVSGVIIGSAIGLYYYLRVAVSLYLNAPQQLNRDAPSNWQYSSGGIVVLISALLILLLGIYPQPLINVVQNTILLM